MTEPMTLAAYLAAQKMTYSAFGRAAGLSTDAVRLLALGLRHPRPGTAAAIAKASGGRVPPTIWYAHLAGEGI